MFRWLGLTVRKPRGRSQSRLDGNRAHKPEVQAKGIFKRISFNALRLRTSGLWQATSPASLEFSTAIDPALEYEMVEISNESRNALFIADRSRNEKVLRTLPGTLTRSTCPSNRVSEASGRVPLDAKTLELSVWTPPGRRIHGLLPKRAVSPSWIPPHLTAPAGPDRHDSRLRSRRRSASARRNCSSAASARASAATRAWASDSARASACARPADRRIVSDLLACLRVEQS